MINFLQRLMFKNMGRNDLLEESSSLTTSNQFFQEETLEDRIEILEGQLAALNHGLENVEDVLKTILGGYLVVRLEDIVNVDTPTDEDDEDTVEL